MTVRICAWTKRPQGQFGSASAAGPTNPGAARSIQRSLPQKRELELASRQLTSIEINGTYYGSQKPATYAKWRDETPDDFVFSLKAPRFAMNRRVLAEAGGTIARFFTSGVTELKNKLGPINWQFMPTKKFDARRFRGFSAACCRADAGGQCAASRRRSAP